MRRRSRIVRVEDLVGQRVRTAAGDVVGRIEDIRVERRGDEHEVTEYLLGSGALAERLGIGQRFGRHSKKLVARWDQMDIHRPERPTLTCPVEELKRE